jgi:hypothetical protein
MKKGFDRGDATERVSGFEMRIVRSDQPEQADEHRSRRIEVLTAWLLAEWERERKEAC